MSICLQAIPRSLTRGLPPPLWSEASIHSRSLQQPLACSIQILNAGHQTAYGIGLLTGAVICPPQLITVSRISCETIRLAWVNCPCLG